VQLGNIIGVSFFALLIPALVVALSGSMTTLTPRQRALRRGGGLSVISATLLAFGLLEFQLIHNSPRPVIEGNLWDIRELNSSEEHWTRFRITDTAGHAVLIQCGYTGPGLVEGERARVRYVAYNGSLLEMDMLSGPYREFHLRESSGEQVFWGWMAIGAVCGFFAYRQLAKIRQEQTTTP
jgi:hypothetical protein